MSGWEPNVRNDGLESPPPTLADAIDRLLGHLHVAPIDALTLLRGEWSAIVGPALAAVSQPVTVREGSIVVRCGEPAWAAQLRWMEATIVQRARERVPSAGIERMRLQMKHQNGRSDG